MHKTKMVLHKIFTFMCKINVFKTSSFSGYQFLPALERLVCFTIFLKRKGCKYNATNSLLSEENFINQYNIL